MTIKLIGIATGKYYQFIPQWLDSARRHFLQEDDVSFVIFTDRMRDYGEDVLCIPTKHEPWPGPTLNRYRTIIASKSIIKLADYVFYSDIDMTFASKVGREIMGEGLTAVHHPGFFKFGTGSWGSNKKSTSFTPKEARAGYFAGGFQGGKAQTYLAACAVMATLIMQDTLNGVTAEWHDETHWNKLLSMKQVPITYLTPSYCMPEQWVLRLKWQLSELPVKIIALEKDHNEIRK